MRKFLFPFRVNVKYFVFLRVVYSKKGYVFKVACWTISYGLDKANLLLIFYYKFLLLLFKYCKHQLESSNVNQEQDNDEEDIYVARGIQNARIIRRTFILKPAPTLTEHITEQVQKDNYYEFNMDYLFDYITAGMEAVVEDQVITAFTPECLNEWNLLTRNRRKEKLPWTVKIIWIWGIVFRYGLLLPLRFIMMLLSIIIMTCGTTIGNHLPNCQFRQILISDVVIICQRIICLMFVKVNFHNFKYKPKSGICVANHTTPADVAFLMTDNIYSLTGQKHNGLFGMFQKFFAIHKSLWFDRFQLQDRSSVIRRMEEHICDPSNPPLLLFPEGTCINNTAVMLFRKGAFELGCPIHPIAIKYESRLADAYFNSAKHSFAQYMFLGLTSWMGACDIWYLPPMSRRNGESSIEFAARVQKAIANQAKIVDLSWDGSIKHVKQKDYFKIQQQIKFCEMLYRKL